MLKRGEYLQPDQVARWFVNNVDRDAGSVITHLKAQKLTYYAQAWFLANFDRSLFKDDLQAWAHGPVEPNLFQSFKKYGWDPIPPQTSPRLPGEVVGFLEAINDEYGQYAAKKLEKMTHEELPWKEARGDIPPEARCSRVIKKLTMRNFYAKRLGKEEIAKLPH